MMISSGVSSMLSFRLAKQYAGVVTFLPSQAGSQEIIDVLAFDSVLRFVHHCCDCKRLRRSPDGITAAIHCGCADCFRSLELTKGTRRTFMGQKATSVFRDESQNCRWGNSSRSREVLYGGTLRSNVPCI